jgi:uncharacterized BrkB/YihY/UPF0761 family membrane protein
MGIGAGIFLIALGAILAFAVDASVSGIDLNVVGWILMLVGAIGLLLTVFLWAPRRRSVVVDDAAPVAPVATSRTVRETRYE